MPQKQVYIERNDTQNVTIKFSGPWLNPPSYIVHLSKLQDVITQLNSEQKAALYSQFPGSFVGEKYVGFDCAGTGIVKNGSPSKQFAMKDVNYFDTTLLNGYTINVWSNKGNTWIPHDAPVCEGGVCRVHPAHKTIPFSLSDGSVDECFPLGAGALNEPPA